MVTGKLGYFNYGRRFAEVTCATPTVNGGLWCEGRSVGQTKPRRFCRDPKLCGVPT